MASTMMRHQCIHQLTRGVATPCFRLHSRTKVAAVASSSSSSSSLLTSATKGGASAAIRAASLVLLLHESFKRAAGRPLVECAELLQLPSLIDTLGCCLLILEPQDPAAGQPPASSSSSSSSSSSDGCCSSPSLAVTYANAAASQLLGGGPALTLDAFQASLAASTASSAPAPASSNKPVNPNVALHLSPARPPVGCLASELLPAASSQLLQLPSQALVQPHLRVYRSAQLQAAGASGPSVTTDLLTCDVCSPSGRTTGRALLFDRWTLADGRIGAPLVPALLPFEVPGDADVQRADEAVRQQADEVRRLKLQQGLGNQDPQVQEAVKVLQATKAKAAMARALEQAYGPGSDARRVLHAFLVDQGLQEGANFTTD